jgi:hypothetical protein
MLAQFKPPRKVPPFKWNPPEDDNINPARQGWTFCDLLMRDMFIDKSDLVHNFIEDYFRHQFHKDDPMPILFVYQRRLGKTTLLDFIEAVYSPLPELNGYSSVQLKTKIAALERGKQLLKYGMHPVLRLNLRGISSVAMLNDHIDTQLEISGLHSFDVAKETTNPAYRVENGARRLNEKFHAETGVETKTFVLIDDYDYPLRDRALDESSPLLSCLKSLFKVRGSDVCLILSGITRIVGTQFYYLDVGDKNHYHGVCGISARELIKCAYSQSIFLTQRTFNGKTFEELVLRKFVPERGGFRQGLGGYKDSMLDSTTPEGALFSPLDVWELVQSLLRDNQQPPSSQWLAALIEDDDCFEFTTFGAQLYNSKSPDDNIRLYRTVLGGVVNTNYRFWMTREEYLCLNYTTQVQKLLYEYGLLAVTGVDRSMICLRSPSWAVTRTAVKFVFKNIKPEATRESLAREYLSDTGFDSIVRKVGYFAKDVVRRKNDRALRHYAFEEYLYLELLFRFPGNLDDCGSRTASYELYREVRRMRIFCVGCSIHFYNRRFANSCAVADNRLQCQCRKTILLLARPANTTALVPWQWCCGTKVASQWHLSL